MKDITLMIRESREGKISIRAMAPLTSKSIIIELNGEDLEVKVYND